jgi:hypothetical protein
LGVITGLGNCFGGPFDRVRWKHDHGPELFY